MKEASGSGTEWPICTYDVCKIFGIFDPPLVCILDQLIVLNSRNLPYYICFWGTPLPPSHCRHHMYMHPKTRHSFFQIEVVSALWWPAARPGCGVPAERPGLVHRQHSRPAAAAVNTLLNAKTASVASMGDEQSRV